MPKGSSLPNDKIDPWNREHVVPVEAEDEEMNAAIREAQATLDVFIQYLASPQPGQYGFNLKARFPCGEGGEHLWLTDVSYAGDFFTGTVNSIPVCVDYLKFGDRTTVTREDVSDWMFVDRGRLVGGYTIRVLRNRMSPEERERFDQDLGLIIDD